MGEPVDGLGQLVSRVFALLCGRMGVALEVMGGVYEVVVRGRQG